MSILEQRAMSGFPLAIGTSLSLETIFNPITEVYDPAREVPDKINTQDYKVYLFNISTITRNIITSVKYEDFQKVKKEELLDTVLEEADFLSQFFTANSLDIRFYKASYSKVKKLHKDKLRQSSTPKQMYLDSMYDYVLEKLKLYDEIVEIDDEVTIEKGSSALIFTHIPWDLRSHDNYSKLDLLESHTGVIKTRKEWYTKYYKVSDLDMSFLPLSKKLLPILGDHVMFKPDKLDKRIELVKYLESKNVNPFTSDFVLDTLRVSSF